MRPLLPITAAMLGGQHHIVRFPFWGTLLLAFAVVGLTDGCSDPATDAAKEAMIAQSALNANNLPAARAAIISAIADRDDVVDYQILHARIEVARGASGAAYNAYSNALALDPTNTEALLGVGQLGLTTGNLPASLDATNRLLDLNPAEPNALLIRGVHSMIKRNFPEAIIYADKVLAASPGNENGAVLKARALYMQKRTADALAALDSIPENSRSEAAALTRLEIFRTEHEASKMLAVFDELRSLRPDDLALRLDEANLRFKLGDRARAQALVSEALADPHVNRENADQAVALLEEYGTQDVSSGMIANVSRTMNDEARPSLARFLIDSGRAHDATVALAGTRAGSAGLKARLLLLNGDVGGAANAAAMILGHDKTDCDALDAAAGSALKQRKLDDALRSAQQAASECPSSTTGWLIAAQAYAALGRASGVTRIYSEALDANKQSAPLARAYTGWLVSEHKSREAIAIARRLTQYAPALLSGWRLYSDLCRRFDQSCVAEATSGLAKAQTILGIDLAPGEFPPNGLVGRFVEQ